jgi:hypothetical protein
MGILEVLKLIEGNNNIKIDSTMVTGQETA